MEGQERGRILVGAPTLEAGVTPATAFVGAGHTSCSWTFHL